MLGCCLLLHLLHCTAATARAADQVLTVPCCHSPPALAAAAAAMHQQHVPLSPAAAQHLLSVCQVPEVVMVAASFPTQKALLLLLLLLQLLR
jgi:hypothetical protein